MKRTRLASISASPPTWSCTMPSASTESPLMVKSRRSASRTQSRPNATLALRPKVSVSSRKVVTSNGCDSTTSVTVPWSMPVGTHLMPAALARRTTSSGSAVVAMSMSPRGIFSSALRTAPPTTRASSPSPLSNASTRAAGPDLSQGASDSTRASLISRLREPVAVLDMRGNVGQIRRRAGEMRQQDEADDDQQQRSQHQFGDQMRRPGGGCQYAERVAIRNSA